MLGLHRTSTTERVGNRKTRYTPHHRHNNSNKIHYGYVGSKPENREESKRFFLDSASSFQFSTDERRNQPSLFDVDERRPTKTVEEDSSSRKRFSGYLPRGPAGSLGPLSANNLIRCVSCTGKGEWRCCG